MAQDDTPTFNLKAVVQETGLKPDTLRAWERRYGLPQPERTAGGHRLYSQRDIDMLKWLIARQNEGLSISRAVDLWERVSAESQDPLIAIPLPSQETADSRQILNLRDSGNALAHLRAEWLAACKSFDERRAEHIMAQAFALYPVEAVCAELLQKGIAAIGDGWYQGEVTVQQEHFASALAVRRLEALLAAAPVPTRPGRILAGCPAEENHTFGLLLIALALRRHGWEVVYLGANVPLPQLQATLASARPNLVVSSAQQLFTAATLLEMAELVYAERVPFAFGGAIFSATPGLAERIPGHFLGHEISQTPQAVEKLLPTPRLNAPVTAVSPEALAARDHFRENQTFIEARVWRRARDASHDQLVNANANMGRIITAALSLGDIAYADNDMAWIRGLLVNHNLPLEMLNGYLIVYLEVLRERLDERGQPIMEWLEKLIV